jgi:hypothetical protein
LCQASALGGRDVLLGIARRPDPRVVDGQPDRQLGIYRLQGVEGGDMGADLVVDGPAGLENVAHPRGMFAYEVPLVRHDERLIEGHPGLHAVAQGIADHGGVLGEPARYVRVRPAAPPEQGGREIPMEKRDERLYAGLEEPVHETVVESDAGTVDGPGAFGEDAWPADREPVAVQTEVFHQLDILGPLMVVVGGDIAILPLVCRPRRVGELVPNTAPGPICQR